MSFVEIKYPTPPEPDALLLKYLFSEASIENQALIKEKTPPLLEAILLLKVLLIKVKVFLLSCIVCAAKTAPLLPA